MERDVTVRPERGEQLPADPARDVERRGDVAPRANLSAALLPAALLVFLALAFVAIVWTVVAAGGAGG